MKVRIEIERLRIATDGLGRVIDTYLKGDIADVSDKLGKDFIAEGLASAVVEKKAPENKKLDAAPLNKKAGKKTSKKASSKKAD